jgi:NitT/TauT family transport system substrate-binding protein
LKRFGIDLDAKVDKNFGSPPLLAEQMKAGRLDALLTFWPFAAKAEAAGARRILTVEDAVSGLGVPAGAPYIGYTFSNAGLSRIWYRSIVLHCVQTGAYDLATSDAEWQPEAVGGRGGRCGAGATARLVLQRHSAPLG